MGGLSPTFRNEKEGQSAHLATAIFQVPLIQNNQHIKTAHFGVICSALLLWQRRQNMDTFKSC